MTTAPSLIELRTLFRQKTVLEVWPTRDIFWVSTQCSLLEALKLLKEKKILSLPVVNTNTQQCIGIIDILEIAAYLVDNFGDVQSITPEKLQNLQVNGPEFVLKTNVFQIMNYLLSRQYEHYPWFPATPLTSLENIMDSFSRGIHRVPIVDDQNRFLNFVSQTDLIRYLAHNLFLLGELAEKTLEELKIVNEEVVFARYDGMVVLALKLMAENKITALPVLDYSDRLVGNFSASDLRGIGATELSQLLMPIGEFLRVYNVKSLFPITCRLTDSFEYMILKVAATGIHRLWCVDEEDKLIGSVSITDLLRSFFESPMDTD